MKFLFNKKKILGGRKRLPGTTNVMGLSKETKKKVNEHMIKNFIKNARDKGEL